MASLMSDRKTSSLASSTQISTPMFVLARIVGVVHGSSVSIPSQCASGSGLATTGVATILGPASTCSPKPLLAPCCTTCPVGFSNSIGTDFVVVVHPVAHHLSGASCEFAREGSLRFVLRCVCRSRSSNAGSPSFDRVNLDVWADHRHLFHLEGPPAACCHRSLWLGIEAVASPSSTWLTQTPDGSEVAHSVLVAAQVLVGVLCFRQPDQLKPTDLATQQSRSRKPRPDDLSKTIKSAPVAAVFAALREGRSSISVVPSS